MKYYFGKYFEIKPINISHSNFFILTVQVVKNRILFFCFLLFFVWKVNLTHSQVLLVHHEEMNMEGLRFWYDDPSKPSHIFNRNIAVHGDCFTVKNDYAFFIWYKGGMENRDLMLSRKKFYQRSVPMS